MEQTEEVEPPGREVVREVGVLERLADGGVHVGAAGEARYELRVCASS